MKNFSISIVLAICALLLCVSFGFSESMKQKKDNEWNLVWEDDFNNHNLDTLSWGYMKRGRDDSRKYHSSFSGCYEFNDSCIVIKGIKNNDLLSDTASYLTGAITTQGRREFFPPCRIEIRAKVNSAQGAWPAFWLLPFKPVNGWPADGEIDIMEHLNYDDFVYQTLHSNYTKADRKAKPKRSFKAFVNKADFNVYGVDILQDRVDLYVNDSKTLSYPKIDSLLMKGQFPFFHSWYLILDMQLGGSWAGAIKSDDLPVEMQIDWVKYYKLKGNNLQKSQNYEE